MARPCVVQLCKNIGNHRFPPDDTLRSRWVEAVEHLKPGLIIRKHSCICSNHFTPADFIPTPTYMAGAPRARRIKLLKRNAVPSLFPWKKACQQANQPQQQSEPIFNATIVQATYSRTPPVAFVEMSPMLESDSNVENIIDPLDMPINSDIDIMVPTTSANQEIYSVETSPPPFLQEHENVEFKEIGTLSVHTQAPEDSVQSEPRTLSVQTQTHGQYVTRGFSIYDYKNDDKGLHFYTGLEKYEKIMLVFYSLGDSVHNLNYFHGPPPARIDALDQLFMVLIILRRHSTCEEISMLFKITVKNVYSVFITWIRLMALQWRNLDLWVDRENVTENTPFDFFDKYPSTRVILDATECPAKKPKLPLAQQVTFSTYKNRNTIKFLLGIAPGGLISYVSPVYGGSATDRQILERSSIIERFNYNDEIMVDKGINVQDILVPYGVKVNMPAFFKKGNQIGSETLLSNRKVASKRVHVERVIGMMKTYKILTQPLNQTEILLASDIVLVIAMLVNFRSNIINKNA